MTRFVTMTPDGRGGLVEGKVSILDQKTMLKCPHVIIAPEHYREDGTCKCNDPDAREMSEWGYVWSTASRLWETPKYQFEWDTFRACMVAEGADGYATEDEAEWHEAYQFLIDTGVVWTLQGTFGRTAADLIEAGICIRR